MFTENRNPGNARYWRIFHLPIFALLFGICLQTSLQAAETRSPNGIGDTAFPKIEIFSDKGIVGTYREFLQACVASGLLSDFEQTESEQEILSMQFEPPASCHVKIKKKVESIAGTILKHQSKKNNSRFLCPRLKLVIFLTATVSVFVVATLTGLAWNRCEFNTFSLGCGTTYMNYGGIKKSCLYTSNDSLPCSFCGYLNCASGCTFKCLENYAGNFLPCPSICSDFGGEAIAFTIYGPLLLGLPLVICTAFAVDKYRSTETAELWEGFHQPNVQKIKSAFHKLKRQLEKKLKSDAALFSPQVFRVFSESV